MPAGMLNHGHQEPSSPCEMKKIKLGKFSTYRYKETAHRTVHIYMYLDPEMQYHVCRAQLFKLMMCS